MEYGIPSFKKFPINNIENIITSLDYFDKCPEKFKEELAENLYNITLNKKIKINEDHNLFNYLNLDNIYNKLIESYIFSKDNIYFNLDKWKKTKNNNILYITGLSGSGKTTISKKIAKKYNAELIEFDSLTSALIHGLENLDISKIHPLIIEYLNTQSINQIKGFKDIENFNKESIKFLIWFQNKVNMNEHSNKLFILEGMQLFLSFEPDFFINKPIIIMGTSVLESWIRTNIRSLNSKKSIQRKFLFFLKSFERISIMINNDNQLSELTLKNKKSLKESNDISKLSSNYKNKKYISLNSFKKSKITNNIAKKYNIECTSPKLIDFKGYIYTDKNDSFVALVAVGTYKNKKSWIQPIEIDKKYRGHGLSKQLIDVAVKELGAKYLGVFSDNEIAIYVYKKYGFKIYKEVLEGDAYFMTIDPKQKIDKKFR